MNFLLSLALLFLFTAVHGSAKYEIDPAFLEKNIKASLTCVNQLTPHDVRSYPYTPEEFKTRHPAFFGCYDWHASVFNHWALLSTLNQWPSTPQAEDIKSLLNSHFEPAVIAIELQNMDDDLLVPLYESAWLLRMIEEVHLSDYPEAKKWSENLKDLEKHAVEYFSKALTETKAANLSMVHNNTAYALVHAWEYANSLNNEALRNLIESRAKDFFLADKNCDASHEIDHDHGIVGFISPCFIEADLMRRVLPTAEYEVWFKDFFPELSDEALKPVPAMGRYEYYRVGLMLQKAASMRGIASSLTDQRTASRLEAAALVQSQTAEGLMFKYGYAAGEHWLPAFFIYSLKQP